MNKIDVSLTAQNRIKGMIEIRDCVRQLIEYQTEDYPDYEIKAQQEKLNTLYDEFTAKYGLINSRGNSTAFSSDSSYFLLCSLEVLNENRELERKADMFTKRTIGARKEVTQVDTATEALPDNENSKVSACANNVYDIWEKTSDKKSAQLVFCDLSTPKGDDTFSVYTDIRSKLLQKRCSRKRYCIYSRCGQ